MGRYFQRKVHLVEGLVLIIRVRGLNFITFVMHSVIASNKDGLDPSDIQ